MSDSALTEHFNLAMGVKASAPTGTGIWMVPEKAKVVLSKKLHDQKQTLGDQHPDTIETAVELADILCVLNDVESAEPLLKYVWDHKLYTQGITNKSTLTIGTTYGTLLHETEKEQEALDVLVQVLQGSEQVNGVSHQDTISVANTLGEVYYELHEYAKAQILFERAVSWYSQSRGFGPDHALTLGTINDLARTYFAQKNHSAAKEMFLRALSGQERTLGADHADTVMSLNNTGVALLDIGDLEAAKPLLQRAFIGRERLYGIENKDTVTTGCMLAECMYLNGETANAVTVLKRLPGSGPKARLHAIDLADTIKPQAETLVSSVDLAVHPHTLVKCDSVHGGWFACDVCKRKGVGIVYHCAQCDFDVHPQCTGLCSQ